MLSGIKNTHKIEYYIVDVFTTEQYGGNQLAVFIDTDNLLDDETMLRFTREINFSESTFIKSGDNGDGYRVRIFTPEYEVPFAGHPIVGTSYVLSKFYNLTNNIAIKLNSMKLEVDRNQAGYSFEISDVRFFKEYDKNDIASVSNVSVNSIDENLPISEISTGLPYLIIPLTNVEALGNVSLNSDDVLNFLKLKKIYKDTVKDGLTRSFYFYTIDSNKEYHARMFCLENGNVFEDAATGSAASCLLAYLLKFVNPKIDSVIHQGYLMNRKSRIGINGIRKGNDYSLRISGEAVMVSNGQWFHHY